MFSVVTTSTDGSMNSASCGSTSTLMGGGGGVCGRFSLLEPEDDACVAADVDCVMPFPDDCEEFDVVAVSGARSVVWR